jgi:hypothetical protein
MLSGNALIAILIRRDQSSVKAEIYSHPCLGEAASDTKIVNPTANQEIDRISLAGHSCSSPGHERLSFS